MRSYTQFNTKLRRVCKQSGNSPQEEIAIQIEANQDGIAGNELTIWQAGLMLQGMVLDGEAIHMFLPDRAFCEWLVSCAPHLEHEHVLLLQEALGGETAFVFHFACGQGLTSFAFHLPYLGSSVVSDVAMLYMSAGDWNGPNVHLQSLCRENENENCFKDDCSSQKIINCTSWYFRLVIGLATYVSCFPEVLRDGPPEDLKHPSHHAYLESKTIGISEKISIGTHASPSAHFRRGHFRILRSEKFTNKRFQAVFVRETFVAGESKTVLTPEEVST